MSEDFRYRSKEKPVLQMKAIPKEDKSKQDKKTIKNHNKKRNIYICTHTYICQLLKKAHCLLNKLILNNNIQSNLAKLLGYRKKEQQQQKIAYMAIQAKRQESI